MHRWSSSRGSLKRETCIKSAPTLVIQNDDILAGRILIVVDKDANVQLLERVLHDAGYSHVTSSTNPLDVCALHRANDYDLILLDLQTPGMDGFQFMEALKADNADPSLPVIVLTAQPEHKVRALKAGAKDFISKPLDLTEVNLRVHNMLEVRLLYRQLAQQTEMLESTVRERTAELRESEASYRSLIELAVDWYWEQDESGAFTRIWGPVLEMLGVSNKTLADADDSVDNAGWNEEERAVLRARIAQRQPFLDFRFNRQKPDGLQERFEVSGEPIFDHACRFIGYRGVGVQVFTKSA